MTSEEKSLSAADDLRVQLLESPETLRRAAQKLAARGDASRLLLIVDQFEEIFTQTRNEGERRAFLENLLAAASSSSSTHIIIGLRADFTGHLAEPEALRVLVQENLVLLGPMQQKDLVRVIMEPARIGGWAYVDGLVDQILKDVGREPGRLPLLSHALLETWKRRSAHVMTLKGYQEAGGVEGAIAKTADDTWRWLGDDNKRAIMKVIFLELTELGEGAENTRRIASRQDLLRNNEGEDVVNEVIEELVQARLITIDNDQVQVAHEALIRRWPRLQDWIEDDRARLSFNRRLTRAAQEWEDNKRDSDYLFRGSQLAQAELRIEEYKEWNLSEQQAVFINASQDAAIEEAMQSEKIEEAGRQNALLSTIFALIGGAISLGAAAIIINLSTDVISPGLYIGFALGVGALTGLIYVPTFDRIVSAVGQRSKMLSWLASILAGMLAFMLAFWWLTAFFSTEPQIALLIGTAWGAVAGAGRLWSQRSNLSRLLSIPLIGLFSGLALVVAFQVSQMLASDWLKELQPPLSIGRMFIIGAVVPLIIMMVEYAGHYVGSRK